MLAEWNVELGADDPTLTIPWSSEDGHVRFLDIKHQPELLLEIREACFYPELAEFLAWANAPESAFETAKCDAWMSRQITEEEEIFGEPCKFGSYIDLLYASPAARAAFGENEHFVEGVARLLRHAPEMSSAAEFNLRRCIDRRRGDVTEECFYVTFSLYGYGEDEQQARTRWAIALKTAQHAMMQYCSSSRNSAMHPPETSS